MNFTDRFCNSVQGIFGKGDFPEAVAVAVSGGADSMALIFALAEYAQEHAPQTQIHVLSVDHRLRDEAAEEVRFVGQSVDGFSNVTHKILVWTQGGQQGTRIEEKAREARYRLMLEYMAKNEIQHLFIGHHQNDQAETFLFRLAKGSGLDGLACMPSVSEMPHDGQSFKLCRPLLGECKADILGYVLEKDIPYIEDPSNQDEQFARVRLRKSMEVLAGEGLTPKRLSMTAKRIKRARDAIEYLVDKEYKNSSYYMNTKTLVLKYDLLRETPLEIVIRVILKAMEELNGDNGGYGPRLERVENLCEDLVRSEPFRKRTLGGIIFEKNPTSGDAILSLEKSKTP